MAKSWGLMAVTMGMAASAAAASVYLNNVKIDGVVGQKFENATVTIDPQGDVYIEAPGYEVKVVTAGPPSKVKKRYWAVAQQSHPGMTDFDIDLYVNSRWVHKFKNSEAQSVVELSKSLNPGKNSIQLIATKMAQGSGRKSLSREQIFRVLVGQGVVKGDDVVIETPALKFERNAAEPTDVSIEYSIQAE